MSSFFFSSLHLPHFPLCLHYDYFPPPHNVLAWVFPSSWPISPSSLLPTSLDHYACPCSLSLSCSHVTTSAVCHRKSNGTTVPQVMPRLKKCCPRHPPLYTCMVFWSINIDFLVSCYS